MDKQNKKSFGKLMIVNEGQNSDIFLCQCNCGGRRLVSRKYLLAGVITNCGCSKERALDLTGQKFGHLTVIEPVQKRDADGSVRWICRCECGEYTMVSSSHLRAGHTKSCGCRNVPLLITTKTFVDGTCVEILLSSKIRKNNSSGRTGVARKGKKWQAYMTYGKKQHSLGTYDSKEDAIRARECAESRVKDHLTALMNSNA